VSFGRQCPQAMLDWGLTFMALYDRPYFSDGAYGQAGKSGNSFRDRLPKTWLGWIVLSNVVIFLLQHVFGLLVGEVSYGDVHGRVPLGGTSVDALKAGKIWGLLTYMFVHGSTLHLLGNMLMIYFAGKALMQMLGEKRMLAIYFLSGIVAAVAHMVLQDLPLMALASSRRSYLIGASGGAFGLLIAFACLRPEQVISVLLGFIIPARLRAKNLALGMVGVSIIFYLITMTGEIGGFRAPFMNWAHMAHLGGAFAAWAYLKMHGLTEEGKGRRIIFQAKKRGSRC